ncbi:MAG: EAL domain-containing protein [Spirochaetes bacterium]|nr:EAL domain-containing protein [Spirochaetota bacterium]
MRVPLRLKVSILWIVVSAVLAWLLGLVLYLTSQQLFTEHFLADKLALARTIARSIDGDVHAGFTAPESAASPEYQRCLRYFNGVKAVDPYITYLFTLNVDRETGELRYAVDADILAADTVYVESDSFAVWFSCDTEGVLEVVADEVPHTGSFSLETADGRHLEVDISAKDGSPLISVAGEVVATIVQPNPLVVETPAGILDAATRELAAELAIDGAPLELTFTFSRAGESASAPGSSFIDTPENLAAIRTLLREDRDYIEPSVHEDVTGSSLSAFAVIHGSRGNAVGMVEIDFYKRELDAFDRVLRTRAMLVTLGVAAVAFAVSLLLSQYLIVPLRRIADAARAVADGRLDTRVPVRRNDEFGDLADGFNGMVTSLDRLMADDREAKRQLATLAYVDQLTSLPNRKAFQDRLREILAWANRLGANGPQALLFLDLDHFKDINDTLGHEAGDRVLREAAGRIRGAVRASDLVFRQGGDEFTVLLTLLAADTDAAFVADKLVQSFRTPFVLDGNPLYLGVSIGIAVHPRDGASADELLRAADTALFEAKRDRNAYRFFNAGMQERAFYRLSLVERLHRGIERGEFRLDFQPQRDRDGRLVGCEGLMRWQPADGELMMPGAFIGVAEETGLIIALGRVAIASACRLRRALGERGRAGLVVSVNLSVRQFRDPELLESIDRLHAEHGIDPAGLQLEITESGLVDEPSVASLMDDLRRRGIRLAIDDFGTGYLSLSRLKTLPIDSLKIDRSFIRELPGSRRDSELVRSVITIAHGFGITACAEGVERQDQMDHLASLGCDSVQGFLFGPAMPEAEFLELACREETG